MAERIPIISRVLLDGTLIETLHDTRQGSTSLAIRGPDATITLAEHFDLPTNERLVPYSAENNLLTSGCVLLASDVGDFTSKAALVADVRAFIHRHVDLTPLFEEIAAHYVLLSWVYDAFSELPYLRFRGEYGSGKTRALMVIGSVCYKPFFASGASTVSPIFHILDGFGGTLVLDEADLRFSDSTADLTKILNNGTVDGLPVLRTMTSRDRELHPQAFKVFGPKIIAMRENFEDDALESRFLTEETGGRALRGDISVHMPAIMKGEAEVLRNRLLAWRFAVRHKVGIEPDRLVSGLSPRGNQTGLALLSLIDDEGLRGRIGDELVAEEVRARSKSSASPRVTMVRILAELMAATPTPYLPIKHVAATYNQSLGERGERPLSAKAVGWLVRSELGLVTMKTRGVYVIPQSERARIEALAVRYAVASEAAGIPAVIAAERSVKAAELARRARNDAFCSDQARAKMMERPEVDT